MKDVKSVEIQAIYMYPVPDQENAYQAECPSLDTQPVTIDLHARLYKEPDFKGDWEASFELELPYSKHAREELEIFVQDLEDLYVQLVGPNQVTTEIYCDGPNT
jgi:hypothetical protein